MTNCAPNLVAIVLFSICCFGFFDREAQAAEAATMDIMNLSFYPHDSKTLTTVQYSTQIHDSTTGTNVATRISYTQFFFEMVYGITPTARIFIGDTALLLQINSSVSQAGNETSTNSTGYSNPILGYSNRISEDLNQQRGVDMTVTLSPSLGAKVPADSKLSPTGNNYSGATTVRVATALFYQAKANEIKLLGQVSGSATGTTNGETASNTASTNPFWQYSASLNDRYHFGRDLFLELSLTATAPFETQSLFADGVTKNSRVQPSVDPRLYIGFRADQNLLIALSYSYHHGKTQTTTATTTTNDTESINSNETAYFTLSNQF